MSDDDTESPPTRPPSDGDGREEVEDRLNIRNFTPPNFHTHSPQGVGSMHLGAYYLPDLEEPAKWGRIFPKSLGVVGFVLALRPQASGTILRFLLAKAGVVFPELSGLDASGFIRMAFRL